MVSLDGSYYGSIYYIRYYGNEYDLKLRKHINVSSVKNVLYVALLLYDFSVFLNPCTSSNSGTW
jgi:hypothetical protein